jgi:iron(II)-dependent oxidoreductase
MPTLPGQDELWIEVPGGLLPSTRYRDACRVPDLWWLVTPLTGAHLVRLGLATSNGEVADLPVTSVTRDQGAAFALAAGGRLPTSPEWEWMAGSGLRRYPWGDEELTACRANLRPFGPGRATAAGAYPGGATPDGVLDAAGNVWEWTATDLPGGGAVIRGGSYNSLAQYAHCDYVGEVPAGLTSPGIGLRVVRSA